MKTELNKYLHGTAKRLLVAGTLATQATLEQESLDEADRDQLEQQVACISQLSEFLESAVHSLTGREV